MTAKSSVHAIVACVGLALAWFNTAAQTQTPVIRGAVYEDRNANGVRDSGEPGLPDVVVSNQATCVTTDARGEYTIDATRDVVSVTTPTGYRVVGAWWHATTPGVGASFGFGLARVAVPEVYTFLHASDTHISEDSVGRVEKVKAIVAARRPSFVLVSGDLVKDSLRVGEVEARRYYDLYITAMAGMSAPVWSVPGNHENFGIERHRSNVPLDHPLYGKKMYRSYLGPTYYSFNVGRIHFVGLDTIDVDDRWYYGHVDATQLAWLERDLAALPDRATVVTFNHMPFYSGALAVGGYEEGEGAANTLIEVNGHKQFRHVVSNASDVLARFGRLRLPLALGGHFHTRERLEFETVAGRTRFYQTAAVVGPTSERMPMASGVTLYTVRGDQIDDGEFIRLDAVPQSR